MKKALSLVLALVLCLALAVPAFAVQQQYDSGILINPAGWGDTRNPVPTDLQGVQPIFNTDANVSLIPDIFMGYEDLYYEVCGGDTLAAIAFAFYGKSDKATTDALYNANKNGHFLASGGILEASRALRIPVTLSTGTQRLDVVNPLAIGDLNGDGTVTAAELDASLRAESAARLAALADGTPYFSNFWYNFYPVCTARMTVLGSPSYEQRLIGGFIVTRQMSAEAGDVFWNQVQERWNQIVYIAKAGDTLNSIAKDFYNNDAAHIIGAIRAANNGISTITAGQYLILPVITIGY